MLQIIKQLLSDEIVAEFQSVLAKADFVDGAKTAGKQAKKVKNNLELSKDSPYKTLLNNAAMGAITSSDELQHGALPLKFATPIFAKYLPGMTYGYHVDNPLMGKAPNQYRSDISMTLFLNNKTDYDGGELSIKTAFGTQEIKLDAGDIVVYPSASLHRVNPVTKGERLVMVTWAQSAVKEPDKRQILFDLWQTALQLSDKNMPEQSDLIEISYANLLRMFSAL